VNQDYRYLPFGGGQRKCLGDMFATFETMTALAMLVRRFSFKLTVGAPPVSLIFCSKDAGSFCKEASVMDDFLPEIFLCGTFLNSDFAPRLCST
jgi:hypothetical protein